MWNSEITCNKDLPLNNEKKEVTRAASKVTSYSKPISIMPVTFFLPVYFPYSLIQLSVYIERLQIIISKKILHFFLRISILSSLFAIVPV